MDPEKTAPFELGRGEDACLLLHGFTGSPWDVRPLGEALAARGLYVKAPRLPGHGATPEAMLHVSRHDWEETAEAALESLRHFRQVFIAGLSMGALLAILLAARFPARVHGIALIAPALQFKGPKMLLLRKLRRYPLLELLHPWVRKDSTDIDDDAARAEAPVLPAFPSARLHDLFGLQDAAHEALRQVHCPSLIAVAENDHVVDPGGGAALARGLTGAPLVRFISLKDGFHIIPRDTGGALLAAEVGDFFQRLCR